RPSRSVSSRQVLVRRTRVPEPDHRRGADSGRCRLGIGAQVPAAGNARYRGARHRRDSDGPTGNRPARQQPQLPGAWPAHARSRRRQVSPASNKTVLVPGTETCGCCEGIGASTPQGLTNRIGLSAIAYRIGDYAQFKDSMVAGLSSSNRSALDRLRTRDADDFTLGLIDAVACAGDVLTFYQERVANESYLRTATERVSLQEMAKLIGYRLRPGVAAE